ncbi:glycerophosphoryl diester phosphodiesterase [Hasllibacter halocynthiae]|uniref:glycerophosphodiester phosphodiesterase n=1 Tax=Hasllibacter halocynthiae TaxID=595589 RepID=A0A2T0X9N6_9RHOB|nr:glycerophosphodiester phosphodiesterase family protein [Hasllibacter halocynthiae]PRY95662.1 glycerophosphoryl diester phosphodiesterase [Hasllibacter halocynthiae]
MQRAMLAALCAAVPGAGLAQDAGADAPAMSYGQRPAHLVGQLEEGELRSTLEACLGDVPERTAFSIGHRGAPLMFPEHTVESNEAAARMGAGILECDVTFTADRELVCRHAQNDLHTTTDILTTDLAEKCAEPFTPASADAEASAECRTVDITLDEFRTLTPKMDAFDAAATSAEDYQGGVADWRTTLYADGATLMTHAESIRLFDALGADFTPELKAPVVEMPYEGWSQEDYAQAMIDEYREAGIDPSRVWPQSFDLADVRYWIENEPEFGRQAVYLMDEYDLDGYDPDDPSTWPQSIAELKDMGVNYIAPPLWMLVKLEDGEIVPNALADAAREADMGVITWTLERSGPLADGGGWYFQSIADAVDGDGDYLELLDVLAQDVGVVGVFSDWPATVTFYANCMGL